MDQGKNGFTNNQNILNHKKQILNEQYYSKKK